MYHASQEEQIMIIYLVMFALLIIIQILISLGWLKNLWPTDIWEMLMRKPAVIVMERDKTMLH